MGVVTGILDAGRPSAGTSERSAIREVAMRIHAAASHPDVGVFLSCDECEWSYGFAPRPLAWLAGLWHSLRPCR